MREERRKLEDSRDEFLRELDKRMKRSVEEWDS